MPKFSARSRKNLAGAHPLLQQLFNEVVKDFDCVVLDSQRGEQAQEEAFRRGNSKARFGQSPHNYAPSLAVDVVPHPIVWEDLPSFKRLATVVKRKAKQLGISISAGADWKTFKDYPHYELSPWRGFAKTSKLFGR